MKTSDTEPFSTIRPEYITPIRWQVWATTAKVVGDEDQRGAQVVTQLGEQFEHLVGNGDIQRGGGFVAQQDLRRTRQRQGDHDPLSHPAGQLVREGLGPALRVGNAGAAHHVDRQPAGLLAGHAEVFSRSLGDLCADPRGGVQSRERLLEDHRDVRPHQRAVSARRHRQQILPGVTDLTR